MQTTQSRRRFPAGVSALAAAGLSGSHNAAAEEVPPETTARFSDAPGICVAPQYVAEELIIARGTDWRLFSELMRELKT
ncbi:hypothetical protein HFO60_29065 [Rhizobium leguminosarum]|uniref:hypothetical protein n=1 Tax=Rhizobium TaxID=379 RepID=UPI00144264C6|nr:MULTISPECIES: hypothetical protein [Rhizobium]MBY5544010.1 hypothetical protein [Rhizobium leguminosarum]MBY5554343.1 hypothetical protein [Rhizobium leguminosarum]MBY5625405.1 hypothetical protein [Rhizobium leguminosarum]MBY5636655.1 hypothetical protein [Rhizobium leguminosarum]MBY5689701.1 hypothetical protein [Rhizobium leguminosarum]